MYAACSDGTGALGTAGRPCPSGTRLNTLASSPPSRSTSTVDWPPPRSCSVRIASPTITNGWSGLSTLAATCALGLGTALRTLGAGWQATSPGGNAYTGDARPAAPSVSPISEPTALVAPDMPAAMCMSSGPVRSSPQSRASTVRPVRHRAAPASIRFSRPLPVGRTAMQKGTHAAVGTQARGSLAPASWPHRGTTHTDASVSRHVPREMQSVVASVVWDAPTVAGPAPGRV